MILQCLPQMTDMCGYLLDSSLTDYNIVTYPPSLRTAAAICLIRKLQQYDRMHGTVNITSAKIHRSGSMLACPVWSRSLHYYTTYEESDLKPMMQIFARILVKLADKNSKFRVGIATTRLMSIHIQYLK